MFPVLGFFLLTAGLSFFASFTAYADQKAIVIVPLADVWNKPAVDSGTLTPDLRETQLLLGEQVIIHSSSGAWVRVETPDQQEFTHDHRWEGYPGWVLGQDVLVLTHDLGSKAAVLDVATSLLGTPYLWGGLGTAGIDCSGLVHWSYRLNGIDVPRDAHEQWMKAKKLKRSQLKPGDLIFSEKTIHPGLITHVAFYLGDGQILEAPQLGLAVRTISFADKYGKPLDQVESGDTVGERIVFLWSASLTSVPLLQSIEIKPVSFRLIKPFVTAAGQKSHTHNVSIRVHFSDGTLGVSEASSSIAMPGESQDAISRVLKELAPELRRQPLEPIRDLIALCWRRQPYHPTAVAALECAFLDAYTRWKGQSLADYFGGKSESVETDFTLSVDTPENLSKNAKAAVRAGFRQLKVKLAGNNPVMDVERLQAVHRAAPKALLVADGNQGFRLSQATTFIHLLNKTAVSLVFLEQPFPRHDYRTLRQFRSRCRIPLMADESCVSPEDALKLFEFDAVDGVNIKVAKSGLLGALDIIHLAQRAKKRLAIGCMEESKAGLAASVHLACGTGAFEWIDLDSVFLLEKSKVRGGFSTKGPKLSVKGIDEGIGIA